MEPERYRGMVPLFSDIAGIYSKPPMRSDDHGAACRIARIRLP